MFFKNSSTTPNSSSNNNNNPSQPNPNNQTNVFSVPTNPPNSSFGSLLSQPSEGLFGNQTQQQTDNIYRNSIRQFGGLSKPVPAPGRGGGGSEPSRPQSLWFDPNIPLNGTVNYIGKANPFVKTKEGHVLHSLTGPIKGVTLDEIRARDYFNLKNNTLNDNEKNKVQLVIDRNLGAEDTPVIQETSQPSYIQKGSSSKEKTPLLASKTSKVSNKPVVSQPQAVISTASSNPGSFNYEFNKMLFVSSLVQTMETHNMTVPEKILDDTDFITKLLEFLGQYDISLPIENIPQFQINSTQLADECE